MADFLGTAFVKVKPDTTGFQGELRKQVLNAIEKTKFSVAISPSLSKGFGTKLREQVKTGIKQSGVHYVTVTPRLAAFKKQIGDELRKSTFDVPVKTKPVAETRTAGTAAEQAGQLSQSQQKAITSTQLMTDALRLHDAALNTVNQSYIRASLQANALAKAEIVLAGTSKAAATLEEALVLAIQSGNAPLIERITSLRNLEVQQQAAAKAAAFSAASEEQLATVRTSIASATAKYNAAITGNLSLEEKDAELSAALTDLKAGQATQEKILAGAREAGASALAAQLAEEQRLLQITITEAGLSAQTNQAEATKAALRKTLTDSTRKLDSALRAEVKSLTTLAEVHQAENAVVKAATAQQKAFSAAVEGGVIAENNAAFARTKNVASMKAELAAQAALIKGGTKRAAQQEQLARGAGATFLSRLGARGATLAAGSEFLIGAAAVTAFAKAVESAASLEQELNVFQATTGALGDEMQRVSTLSKQLGADITLPSVSAGDAASAMTNLAKAGLDVEDSMSGARGVLQLATAAQIENAQATELVASALNAFSLAGTDATRVADLLTGSANESQGSITDMGIALQQASAVARQAGLSLEDTVTFVTLLARAGIRGSDAGTSLRTALLRLISPTDKATKQLRALGIQVTDANGAIRPEVFFDLNRALQDLNSTARNKVLREIFGQDAIRAAVIFGREGKRGFATVKDAITEMGLASELAEARTKGFSGKVSGLQNSIETLGISIGRGAIPLLTGLIDTLNEVVIVAQSAADALEKIATIELPGIGKPDDLFPGFAKWSLGDLLKEARASAEILDKDPSAWFSLNLNAPTQQIKDINTDLERMFDSSRDIAQVLKDDISWEDALDSLQRYDNKLIGNSETAEKVRERIQSIQLLVEALGRKPTIVELGLFLDEKKWKTDIARIRNETKRRTVEMQVEIGDRAIEMILAQAKATGKKAVDIFVAEWKSVLTPEAFKALMEKWFGGMPKIKGPPVPEVPGRSGEAILGQLAGFDRREVAAQLRGADEDLLSVLREEEAFIQKALRSRAAKRNVGLRAQLNSELLDTQNAITDIIQQGAQDRESAANEAKQKIADADQAQLAIFTGAQDDAAFKLQVAKTTDTLSDDIKRNVQLRALYRKQKKVAIDKIKDKTTLKNFLKDINQKLRLLNIEINDLLNQQDENRRSRIRENINLDIEFFQTTENRKGEIAARKKLIKELIAEQKLVKKGSAEWKRLRNEIAAEQAAIKELQAQQKERNNAFKEMTFEFLQRQQGFAANLLGNLIGGGVTEGLVGNASIAGATAATAGEAAFGLKASPGAAINPEGEARASAMIQGGLDRGPTSGQATNQIQLLRQILGTLQSIAGKTAHPEAQYQRRHTGGAMDTQ